MSVKIENIVKTFGKYKALRGINLEINQGELIALLGPSGCGKTTLLRIIAGLEIPDSGKIYMFDEDMTDKSVKDRNVGFVFQHYALFKHMNVYKNIAFGLNVKSKKIRPDKNEIDEKVKSKLNLIQLNWAAKKYPSQLSGGERQRVALARALAVEPKILLLDEPFGALDAKVRRDLRKWVRHLHDDIHLTTIFVTHDQEEALEIADQVIIMNKGEIVQAGTALEVYEKPANEFVYNFLGNVNRFSITSNGKTEHGEDKDESKAEFVRPHEIKITREGREGFRAAKVLHIYKYGASARIELQEKGSDNFIDAAIPLDEYSALKIKVGDEVFFYIATSKTF